MRTVLLWLFWIMAVTSFMKLVCVAFVEYPMKVKKITHVGDLVVGTVFLIWMARVLWP